jgi:hypothetical protein
MICVIGKVKQLLPENSSFEFSDAGAGDGKAVLGAMILGASAGSGIELQPLGMDPDGAPPSRDQLGRRERAAKRLKGEAAGGEAVFNAAVHRLEQHLAGRPVKIWYSTSIRSIQLPVNAMSTPLARSPVEPPAPAGSPVTAGTVPLLPRVSRLPLVVYCFSDGIPPVDREHLFKLVALDPSVKVFMCCPGKGYGDPFTTPESIMQVWDCLLLVCVSVV